MQYLTMLLAVVIIIFFIGCAKQNVGYVTYAQTIRPVIIVPVGIKVKKSTDYYLIPKNIRSIIRSYSLVPPGSDLQRFCNQSQLQSPKPCLLLYRKIASCTAHSYNPQLLIKNY